MQIPTKSAETRLQKHYRNAPPGFDLPLHGPSAAVVVALPCTLNKKPGLISLAVYFSGFRNHQVIKMQIIRKPPGLHIAVKVNIKILTHET